MIFRQIAVNILLDLYDTSTRLMADAGAIVTPTLLFVAGADWVVKNSAQQAFFNRLSSPVKRMVMLPGFYHAIFHEKNRQLVVSKGCVNSSWNVLANPPQRDFLVGRGQSAVSRGTNSTGCADRAIRCSV